MTTAILVLAFLAVPTAAGPSPAQERPAGSEAAAGVDDSQKTPPLKRALQEFTVDTGRIWSSPFRIKKRHLGPLILLAATTSFFIAADEDIRDAFKSFSDEHGWVGDISPVITQLGGPAAWAAAGIFFGAGLVFKDGRARDTGYLAASALIHSFFVSHIAKGFSGRRRPFAGDGDDRWAGPGAFFKRYDRENKGLYDSFPSGHASAAFSLATVVALQYRHRTWVPVLAYSLAALASVSRVTEDRHWISDAFVGALLGHLVARLVVHSRDKRQRLVPILGCSGRSVAVGFQYALDPVRR